VGGWGGGATALCREEWDISTTTFRVHMCPIESRVARGRGRPKVSRVARGRRRPKVLNFLFRTYLVLVAG